MNELCSLAPPLPLELGQYLDLDGYSGGYQVHRAQLIPEESPWHCELLCREDGRSTLVLRPKLSHGLLDSVFTCTFDFGQTLQVHYIPMDVLQSPPGQPEEDYNFLCGICEVQGPIVNMVAQWLEIDPALLSGISSLPVPCTAPDRPAPSADLSTPAPSPLAEADRPRSATAPPPEAHSPPTAPSQSTFLLLAPALCALLAAAWRWRRGGRRRRVPRRECGKVH